MARRKRGEAVSGWVVLDKPLGLGSTPAVGKVRRAFDAQKAGHAGTLDPLATGVLPIALGEATKTVPFLQDATKTYRFTVAFGRATDTLDLEGETVSVSEVRPTPDQIAAALPAFIGNILQAPPAYSAIRVDGERAYDLARAGEAVDLPPRPVTVHALTLIEARADEADLELVCGKGTYVRSLARDLSAALETVGHVAVLRRTRVGPFEAAGAIALESLEALSYEARRLEALRPVATALDDIPALAVSEEDAAGLTQGRAILLVPRQVQALQARLVADSLTVSAMRGDKLVALCEVRAGRLNPVRVFQNL